MYTLKLESLNSNYNKELKVETLNELFNDNAPLHEELEDFKLSGLYDDLGYSLVILKPYHDDFLIVYVNKLLFGMNDVDFPQKIKGKCYGEVFPKLKKLNNLDKLNEVYSNDSHNEFIFKIFDGKKLIFAGRQNYIRQGDYLYYFVKDETSDYIIKENYELVFKNSSFPIFIIDTDKNIIKANYAFLQNVNYSLNELNHLNINNFISKFESSDENINSFDEALDKLFSKELVFVNCEGKIINRKSNFKWFKASLRLKTSDTIEIIYQDITKNKIVERNNDFLSIFLEDLQKETKTALTILDENGFHWSDEIFNILEVPTEKRVYDYGKENIILEHTISSDKHIITDAIESLSPEKNIVNFIYQVKTDNGNYKYLKTIIKNLYEEDNTVTVSFTQDVTEEEVAKKNSIDAMKNLRTITTNNKMAIVIFKNGSYTISPEFYEMLEINPQDFSQNIDLMEYFALPEEKTKYKSQKESLSPENPLIHYSLTSKISNNKIKYFDGFIEAEFDEEGNAFKSVNFIRDVTEETLVKQETLALKEGLDAVAEFSKIAIVSYNDGKYRWSDELFNMLKINPEDYDDKTNILSLFEHSDDLKDFERSFKKVSPENNTIFKIIRLYDSENNMKYFSAKLVFTFDEDGYFESMHELLQDITEEILTKESALKLKENLDSIQKTSKIVIGHYKNGKYNYTDEIYDILEIQPNQYGPEVDLIGKFSIEDNLHEFTEKIEKLSPENPETIYISNIKTANGNEKVLKGYLKANFNEDGEFIELVTFIHEITEQVKREKELETLSEDRKLLLQEVHHRVKNNLQLILSFLNIESRFNKNNPEYVIEQTRNRIRTMALTHEEVYQSQNVSSVNLESFLSKNMYNLFKLYDNKKIDLNFKMEPVEVNIDIGIPLGLLINELAINCIKYAFPEKDEGNFYINVSEKENIITIKVWDDGVGLPDGVDLNNNNEGLGFLIIQRLSQQLEAELKVLDNRHGFGIELKFKNDYGGLYCIK